MTNIFHTLTLHPGKAALALLAAAIIGALIATRTSTLASTLWNAHKRTALALIGWCVLSWLAAGYRYDYLAGLAYRQESTLAAQQVENIADNINDNIEMLKGISMMYARDEDTRHALLQFGLSGVPSSLPYEQRKQRWTQDKTLRPLDNTLAGEATLLGADQIFILNAAGDCVAASLAGKPGSPIGTNYADRKYFPLARAGQPGHQYAVGRTTGIPGLYYVSPVHDKGRFLGAVVVKRDVGKFARWTEPSHAFVVDANGVVILASDKRHELRTLSDTPLAKWSPDEIKAQYRRDTLAPLAIAPWGDDRFPSAVLIDDAKQPVLLSPKPLADDGISIYVPRPLNEIVNLSIERVWSFLLLAAAGCMLIVATSTILVYRRESRQREAITRTFGKYVDPRIVDMLIADQRLPENGDTRMMTVYFCDLEGFTAISEKYSAEKVIGLLNRFLLLMTAPIRQHHGIIDKYIGDSIMAFWGPPFTAAAEHPLLACQAALRQIEALRQFETKLPGLPKLRVRIGISAGEVIVGSIGSEVARSYTVIGDNVNLASRLESINKYYGTQILICEEVWRAIKDEIECREIDHVRVAGKARPIRIFEVLGRKGELNENGLASRNHFKAGLAAYRSRRWDEAEMAFAACLKLNDQDLAAAKFLTRIETFRMHPPGLDWDGIWSFSRK